MKTRNEILGRLYAVETEYLNECGWVPYVWNGIVLWKDPQETEHPDRKYRQDVAIAMEKLRITE